jgi:hypothetical protein
VHWETKALPDLYPTGWMNVLSAFLLLSCEGDGGLAMT